VPDNNQVTLPRFEDPDSVYPQEFPSDAKPLEVDPNNPPWGIGGALLIWVMSIALIGILPVVFLIAYAAKRGIQPGNPNFIPAFLQFAITDKTAVLVQVLSILPSHLLTLVLIWALVTRFGKRPFLQAIGWGWAPRFHFWSCVGLGVALFVAGSILAKLLGTEKPTQLEQIINSSLAARYAISFLAVFTAPFVEEFIYRGVLYAPLQRLAGVRGAVLIVLALFTIIHVPQYWPNMGVLAAVALLSIVLTVIRAYSGKLLPCIVIHIVFNGIQAAFLIAEPYAQRFLPNTEPTAAPTATSLFQLIGIF
jgi:membrane protease YdiL (CAAX protease family)